jgi:mycofactocin precursor peptide peptidase
VSRDAAPDSRGLPDAYWPDVDAAPRGVLLLPVGALEQHGPHLPLDTDTALALRVAAQVHQRRPGTGLAPAVAYGSSGEHSAFPGTLSIGTEVLALVVTELVRDASRWWQGVLVVNGHGGNLDALQRAQQVCAGEGRRIAVCHLALPGMDAHAGRSETALMTHLDPGRVRAEAAVAGRTEPIAELMDALRQHGVRDISSNGVLGDPGLADAAHGADLFERLVAKTLRAHDDLTRDEQAPDDQARDDLDQ